MNAPIVVTIDWTDDEIGRAYGAYIRTSMQWRRMRAVWWMIGTALLVFGLIIFRRPFVLPAAMMIGAGLSLLAAPFRHKRRVVRAAVQNFPDRNRVNTCTLSRDRYAVRNEVSLSEVLWSAFQRVLRTSDGFLLHRTEMHFAWLPLDGFSSEDDIERFVSFARNHLAEYHESP
jgi:hypothetical protein